MSYIIRIISKLQVFTKIENLMINDVRKQLLKQENNSMDQTRLRKEWILRVFVILLRKQI